MFSAGRRKRHAGRVRSLTQRHRPVLAGAKNWPNNREFDFDSVRGFGYSKIGMSTIISASEVTVRYNERAVLDDITLGIQEGDRIGLVGRNGCGKTTFLKILAGLQHPDSGEVSRQRDLVASYLPQDFMLDATRNVQKNIHDGAQHVLDLIKEFESLPHDSTRNWNGASKCSTAGRWTGASKWRCRI
jgi:ATPase subunit of ABC transporter with duplicated ATPase domains